MQKPTCSVETCVKQAKYLGWCSAHYQRNAKYGDPLGQAAPRVIDFPDGTRQCTKCGERKPLAEFPVDKTATLGRRGNCRICHTAAQSARYHADPERHKTRIRAFNAANRDLIRARNKAAYEKDKPRRIEYAKAAVHKRRALLAKVTREPGITTIALRKRDGKPCHYCKVTMSFKPVPNGSYNPVRATLEHLTPLSRGGTHTWANVVLACWKCNVRKQGAMDGEWEGSACPTLPFE